MSDPAFHEEEAATLLRSCNEDGLTVAQADNLARTAAAHAEVAKSMRLGEIAAAIRGEVNPDA